MFRVCEHGGRKEGRSKEYAICYTSEDESGCQAHPGGITSEDTTAWVQSQVVMDCGISGCGKDTSVLKFQQEQLRLDGDALSSSPVLQV